MLRSACCLITLANLTACIPEAFVKHDYVEVPTPVSCVTWEPARTPSVFDLTDKGAPLWEQVKALLTDRESDQSYIDGQQAVIEGCR